MPGKEAGISNSRQKRLEAEHAQKNAFVKKQQAEMSRMAGRPPMMKGEAMEFNAYMCNNGAHAQELASKVTEGLDKMAYPVNPNVQKE